MKGKSSFQQGKEQGMEIANLKEQHQPHVSGAYIRSLVKQLSHNSRHKDSLNPPKLDKDVTTKSNSNESQQSEPPQQHKKQVRRRLHTTRPYQERLLNMAEARREIVTALKFHRASMKQQQQQQQQKKPEVEVQPLQPLVTPRRIQRNYEGDTSNFIQNFSASNMYISPPPSNPYHTTYPVEDNLMNFALPNQALGLNLNLQDFNNLETSIYPSIYSSFSSASSSSSSSPPISYSSESFPSMASQEEGVLSYVDLQHGDIRMHQRMDDKEIAKIKSIGDQHQMELNDTLNLVSSAWWCKFLNSMGISGNEESAEDDYGRHPFDEIMEFPDWLSANESYLQQHLQDYYSDDYFKDPDLPCMNIEDIEGMDDGEWLS